MTTTGLGPELAAPSCAICGKTPAARHTSATRAAHAGHLTRLGWSGMCPAPRDETPKGA